jgi:hypothetical protein
MIYVVHELYLSFELFAIAKDQGILNFFENKP